MKYRVRVETTMEYTAEVEAKSEVEAMDQAKLDALLADSYDYQSQTAECELISADPIDICRAKFFRVVNHGNRGHALPRPIPRTVRG